MKKCHFCAEEIQDDAIKCRHCDEFINVNDSHEKIKNTETTGNNSTSKTKKWITFFVGGFALLWMISDGIEGMNNAEKWGTSKFSAFVGGMLGGSP
jgi:hypothetical protein